MTERTYPELSPDILAELMAGHTLPPDVKLREPNWDDLRVPLVSTRAAANAPDFAQLQDDGAGSVGIFSFLFDANTMEQLFFAAQLPHRYKPGTNLRPHLHGAMTTGGAGTVSVGLELSLAPFGVAVPQTTILSAAMVASGEALQHQIAAFPEVDGTGLRESSMIRWRSLGR